MTKGNIGQRLQPWQEIAGFLKDVRKVDGETVLDISIDISIVLPCFESDQNIKKFLGKRIRVLRTDSQCDAYKIRLMEKKKGCKENGRKKRKQNRTKGISQRV